MKSLPSILVLLAVGGVLIVGAVRSISAAGHPAKSVSVVFEAPSQTAEPTAEPLFPGLPTR